jgi:GTP 3',8-cyclase
MIEQPSTGLESETALVDRFGRRVTYLRLSVTDRCDLRCLYCMGPEVRFLPRHQILSLEEMLEVVRAFVALGVTKVRLTGGEPLVRRNLLWLMREVARLPGLAELVLTTNGTQLGILAQEIRDAGVRRINVSLDTLRPERFARITGSTRHTEVLAGIEAALRAGFERIKLNAVILRHRNHDEVTDLVGFAVARGINISFIEEMPLGRVGEHDRAEAFYSSDEIQADLAQHFALVPTTETTGGPARYFRIPDTDTRVGFIAPHSHNFCGDCNRVRVTADGRLLLCLGQEHSMDLRPVLRASPGDQARLRETICAAMQIKPAGHEFRVGTPTLLRRQMNLTGG